jgi:hypothetical protein
MTADLGVCRGSGEVLEAQGSHGMYRTHVYSTHVHVVYQCRSGLVMGYTQETALQLSVICTLNLKTSRRGTRTRTQSRRRIIEM